MSWSLTRPNVVLRIARFASATKPVAGLSDRVRAAHKAQRARECRKVRVWFRLTN